jgi:hypothetical protein
LLEEYAQAIKSCDRDTLATLVPKEVSQVIGHACDKYPSLDATVAYLSEERGTKGTTVHFTQKIEGVSPTGEIEMIAQAKLKATVVQETSGELRILDIARDQ